VPPCPAGPIANRTTECIRRPARTDRDDP